MKNSVYLSPLTAGQIYRTSEEVSICSEILSGKEAGFLNAFSATVIQCGITEFVVPDLAFDMFNKSALLANRVKQYEALKNRNSFAILDFFRSVLPENFFKNPKYNNEVKLCNYLLGIADSLEFGNNMLEHNTLIDFSNLSKSLPLEFVIPVKNFVENIDSMFVSSSIPKSIIHERDFKLILEIVESIWFEMYCEAQAELGNFSVPQDILLDVVKERCSSLIENFDQKLNMSNIYANTIKNTDDILKGLNVSESSTSKAISGIFKLFSDLLYSSEKSIVIYNFDSIAKNISEIMLINSLKNLDNSKDILERLEEVKLNKACDYLGEPIDYTEIEKMTKMVTKAFL